jgi:hypothetical protein
MLMKRSGRTISLDINKSGMIQNSRVKRRRKRVMRPIAMKCMTGRLKMIFTFRRQQRGRSKRDRRRRPRED